MHQFWDQKSHPQDKFEDMLCLYRKNPTTKSPISGQKMFPDIFLTSSTIPKFLTRILCWKGKESICAGAVCRGLSWL